MDFAALPHSLEELCVGIAIAQRAQARGALLSEADFYAIAIAGADVWAVVRPKDPLAALEEFLELEQAVAE